MELTSVRRGKRLLVPLTMAVLAGAVIGAGVDRYAFAQQPGIKRTILEKTDDPGSANYEAVLGVAELPPGATSGKHRHPGVELGYVLSGSVVVEHEGGATATYSAGQAFTNKGGVHNARNPGTTPVKILAVYIVKKGVPMAEPVK